MIKMSSQWKYKWIREQTASPRANIQSLVENKDEFLDVEQLNGWRLHLLSFTSLSEAAHFQF